MVSRLDFETAKETLGDRCPPTSYFDPPLKIIKSDFAPKTPNRSSRSTLSSKRMRSPISGGRPSIEPRRRPNILKPRILKPTKKPEIELVHLDSDVSDEEHEQCVYPTVDDLSDSQKRDICNCCCSDDEQYDFKNLDLQSKLVEDILDELKTMTPQSNLASNNAIDDSVIYLGCKFSKKFLQRQFNIDSLEDYDHTELIESLKNGFMSDERSGPKVRLNGTTLSYAVYCDQGVQTDSLNINMDDNISETSFEEDEIASKPKAHTLTHINGFFPPLLPKNILHASGMTDEKEEENDLSQTFSSDVSMSDCEFTDVPASVSESQSDVGSTFGLDPISLPHPGNANRSKGAFEEIPIGLLSDQSCEVQVKLPAFPSSPLLSTTIDIVSSSPGQEKSNNNTIPNDFEAIKISQLQMNEPQVFTISSSAESLPDDKQATKRTQKVSVSIPTLNLSPKKSTPEKDDRKSARLSSRSPVSSITKPSTMKTRRSVTPDSDQAPPVAGNKQIKPIIIPEKLVSNSGNRPVTRASPEKSSIRPRSVIPPSSSSLSDFRIKLTMLKGFIKKK